MFQKITSYFTFGCTLLILTACNHTQTSIKIKGSDTEVNLVLLLAEKFYTDQKNLMLSISGGGSGLGIATLLNGQADIANSSRPMNDYERNLFKQKGIEFIELKFAQDALVIIVNEQNPIDSLSQIELEEIFKGKKQYWSASNQTNQQITIYGRQSNSGTHAYLKYKLNLDFSTSTKEMNGNAQIIEAIKADRSGIGYVGAGYVIKNGKQSSKGYKILKLSEGTNGKAHSPLDSNAVKEKKYFLIRPLYQYILKGSYAKAKPFLDFEQSIEGNQIITINGYYPTNY